jgi:transposase
MTNVKHFVGIDVSKNFFDVAIVKNVSKGEFLHQRFDCNEDGFNDFHCFLETYAGKDQSETVICMEYTGIYNWPIVESLSSTQYVLCMEMAMQIKYCLGIQRGKNDKLDAKRIAEYAYIQREKLRQWRPSGKVIEKLQHLMASRERLIKAIQMLEVPINEINQSGNKVIGSMLSKTHKPVLKSLEKALEQTDKNLQHTLNQDETILELYNRITSVKGIGKVIGMYLIIYTKGFTMMADKKKLGSYAGVVPFEHSSGKTVKKRSKTSKMTNANLRCNLAMGAKSAMQWDPELKAYAEKKRAEGKSYGWCINAVSNKLLGRVVSCVNNQKNYVVKMVA